jgi:hypothetical protein
MLKFKTKEDRDTFANRLSEISWVMLRCRDQGSNCMIAPTDEMIDDIRAAAAIVASCDIASD